MRSLTEFINESNRGNMEYPLAAAVLGSYGLSEPIDSPKAKKMLQDYFSPDKDFRNFNEYYKFILDNRDVVTPWVVDIEGRGECEVVGNVKGKEIRLMFTDYDEYDYPYAENYVIDSIETVMDDLGMQ